MAQIGSPPAGWYTDPSGQHRARYWDGAGWTEQVRNDVATPGASSAADATPNDAAATVAGVAQVLATVAEQDVVEPPFVVDYGVEPEPLSGTFVDPFGGDPLPSLMDPSTTQASVSHPSFAQPSLTQPSPVIPEPAPAGPAAGWYPDPSARHQARLWDGMRWTERVADNGVEGIDPVPGAPATSAAATQADDTATAAWSAQLLSGTNVDGALPIVPDSGEPQMTAGQASLAKLGEAEYWDDEPARTRTRPRGKVYVAGWMVLAGAVALLAGSSMPWMQVRGPRVGDSVTESGVNLGDGRITIVLAILLAILGVGILTGRLVKVGGTRVGAMGALVAGAAAVAVTAVDIADVAERARSVSVFRPARSPTWAWASGCASSADCSRWPVASWPSPTVGSGRKQRRAFPLATSPSGRAQWFPQLGDVAQLARAPALQAGGRGFESHRLHHDERAHEARRSESLAP